MTINAKFKKGTYYIGDLCYIFNDSWGDLLTQTQYLECGLFEFKGLQMAAGSTAHGDGSYSDNSGLIYGVDSGTIGIAPIAAIDIDNKKSREDLDNWDQIAHVVTFDDDFEVTIEDGIFDFGEVHINTVTDNEDGDELDYDFDEDEDDEDEDE